MKPLTTYQKAWCAALVLWIVALVAAFAPESKSPPASAPAPLPAQPAPAAPPPPVAQVTPKESTPTAAQETPLASANPMEPVWMVDPTFRHGLEDDILELRAKRAVQPAAGFIHQEEVTWARHEDGSGANLEDGRVMRLGKGNVDYWVAIRWKPGTKLLLCYSETDGVLLIEPEKGAVFKVDVIYGRHPLENYQDEMEKHVTATLERIALSNDLNTLWGLEADRCVREVLENPHVPASVKENLVRLTHARKAYEETYHQHVDACLEACYGDATMRRWHHSDIGNSEDRRFAQQLLAIRYEARFFMPPQKPEEGK